MFVLFEMTLDLRKNTHVIICALAETELLSVRYPRLFNFHTYLKEHFNILLHVSVYHRP